jgi:hypothetical protein
MVCAEVAKRDRLGGYGFRLEYYPLFRWSEMIMGSVVPINVTGY